ncbi:MAG: hypothetical protein AAF433_02185 [Bacteroidota bacterium]
MIRTSFALLSFLLLLACGETTPSSSTTDNSSPTEQTNTSTYKAPCESVSNEKVGAVFGWADVQSTADELMDGRVQACTYYYPAGNDGLVLRLDYANEYARTNQFYENTYQKYLAEGQDDFSYQTLSGGPGDETLIGYAFKYRKHNYLLRSRKGNELELIVDASFMEVQDEEQLQAQLLELANEMTK